MHDHCRWHTLICSFVRADCGCHAASSHHKHCRHSLGMLIAVCHGMCIKRDYHLTISNSQWIPLFLNNNSRLPHNETQSRVQLEHLLSFIMLVSALFEWRFFHLFRLFVGFCCVCKKKLHSNRLALLLATVVCVSCFEISYLSEIRSMIIIANCYAWLWFSEYYLTCTSHCTTIWMLIWNV